MAILSEKLPTHQANTIGEFIHLSTFDWFNIRMQRQVA